MRKKPRFTHVMANLRGDVSGKRFSTHVGEGNVADIAQERLSDETGCTDTWHCLVSPVTEHCYWIPSQGTVSGHDKSSRAGEADGAVVQGHSTSLPGIA